MRAVMTLLALFAITVLAAPSAAAHTDVNEYTPGLGEVVQTTPEEIRLEMSTDPGNINVRLFHRDGTEVPLTGTGVQLEDRSVTAQPPALDVGTYVITWESVGPDGHLTAGQSHFSVGAPDGDPLDLTSDTNQSVSPFVKAAQWLGYLALAVAFGAAWLALMGLAASPRRLRLLAFGAGLTLLAAEATRLVFVSAQFGSGSVLDGASQILTRQPNASGWLLVLVGAGLIVTTKPWLGLVGVTAASFGDVLTGHLASTPQWPLLVGLASVHLIAVAIWVGPLVAHLVAGRRGRVANLEFATKLTWWALGAVAAIAVSGVTLAYLRMGTLSLEALFSREYGMTLLYKIGIVLAIAAPLGAYHAGRVLLVKAREYEDRVAKEHTDGATTTPDTPDASAPDAVGDSANTATSAGRVSAGKPGFAALTIVIELIALVAVTFLGASLSGMAPNATTVVSATGTQTQDLLAIPESFEECLGSPDEAGQLICIEKYLTNVAQTEGMPKAIDMITTRWMNGDVWMQKYCHVIGHKIGRLGYRMFQDIPTAFKQGSDPCDYGYLHGVIEGASADFTDQDLREAMPTMCDPVGDISSHTFRQCIHGLGHAAARRVNNDLARGMEFCDVFYVEGSDVVRETDEEGLLFNLCGAGVSMEWNTQPKALDAMTLPIGAPGTLLGECVRLPERYHPSCIEYGTSAMGGILEREIEARDWCDENLEEPLPCYWSIGRDVIWSPTITPEQAMEVCTGGKQGIYAEECIARALGSVATIKLDADAIDAFCPVVPEQYQFLCPIVRDAMRTQIEQTVRGYILEEDAPAGDPSL